ncbi:MAG: hydroxyacid dehydrogenase [Bacillota bacterium]
MRVAFYEVEPWEEQLFREELPGYELVFRAEPLKEEEPGAGGEDLGQGIEALSVFIHSDLTRQVLARFPDLRLVATRSTGYDHIDLEACKERGIAVSNVPYYGENTVAEHTFALILSLSRNIHRAYLRTIRGDFSLEGLRGFDLKGKTIGVVGAGRIGLHVIGMAKGFGMEALAFDPKQDHFLAEVIGFRYVSLAELLAQSDIISLHAPLLPSTQHLINKENIRQVKPGALLINTSRGGLVETDALFQGLEEGILAGAGLDVLEGEEFLMEEGYRVGKSYTREALKTIVQNQALLHREDVVITPHNAFNSREAARRIIGTTAENLRRFAAGDPVNLVKG